MDNRIPKGKAEDENLVAFLGGEGFLYDGCEEEVPEDILADPEFSDCQDTKAFKDYFKTGNVMDLRDEICRGWVRFWRKRDPNTWPLSFKRYLKTPMKWG